MTDLDLACYVIGTLIAANLVVLVVLAQFYGLI